MKKTRTVEYDACDVCGKEIVHYGMPCFICGTETCGNCQKEVDITAYNPYICVNYVLCAPCYARVGARIEDDAWAAIMDLSLKWQQKRETTT